MTYLLNKSQKAIQKAAMEFARGEFDKDAARELDRKAEFPAAIWKKAAELGFIGMHFPEAYDGGGLDLLDTVLLAEQFCRRDATVGSALMLAGHGSECLLRHGSNELKDKFIPQVVTGECLSSIAWQEKQQNNGLKNISTTAIKDGNEWIINGKKTNVLNSGLAGFYGVVCGIAGGDGQQNSHMILVEKDCPGITFSDRIDKLGLRMVPSAQMQLENVRVPFTNLIGKAGHGLKQAYGYLDEFQILIAALALGIAQGALDRAIDYVKQREQFGRKIARFQITRHKLADMVTKIEQSRFLTYAVARAFDHQRKFEAHFCAMVKQAATRTAVAVAGEAVQLLGGYGYMTEYEIERFHRDAKCLALMGGNQNDLKDTIARAIIGRIK
jgi:alkylation response protein AidB-like acyl-CoA dehydrogenase